MTTTETVRIARVIRDLQASVASDTEPDDPEIEGLFQRWAGVGLARFAELLRSDPTAERLAGAETIAAGGPAASTLHPLRRLRVDVRAMEAGDPGARGEGMEFAWGVHPTPFGDLYIAAAERGIGDMAFIEPSEATVRAERTVKLWPAAAVREDPDATRQIVREIFGPTDQEDADLPVLLRGTPFQLRVWQALLRIPAGRATTYREVARAIGAPTAARAVGAAIGANRIAYLVPCHRVIPSTGSIGRYRWGAPRKSAILAWEQALDG